MGWILQGLKGGISGGGNLWKPSDSPGLSDWFTASHTASVTTPNGNVTSWTTRRSGGTNNLATLTGTPTHDGTSINFLNGNHSLAATSIDNGAITNGSCMLYVVCDTDKVASHYICGYDINNGNPGLALRYWQATNSWFAYCDSTSSSANVSTSAAGTAANEKVLLGVRVNGTTLSISVNGAVTVGGVAAAPFVATRFGINQNPTRTSLGRVYDIESFTAYDVGTALRIEGELAHKHGITLPNGHPYRTAPPTTAWNPADDSGLTIWYDFADASTITITGAGISQLLNKVPGGTFTLTQSTDANRPTWSGDRATGRTGVSLSVDQLKWTGTVNFTNAAYIQMSTSIYGAFSGSYGREWRVSDGATSTYHNIFLQDAANNARAKFDSVASSGGEFTVESNYTPDSTFSIRAHHFNGLASGTVVSYKNGTQINTLTISTINPIVGGAMALFTGTTANITLGDFIVTSATSTAIRQKYEGWLAWKRGIQSNLDVSHPYKSRPPLITD